MSSKRLGSGPPGRFALVAATAPTRARTSRTSPSSRGTRTPIVSGRSPVSQRKRRAGFGRMSVYGPGSSARAIVSALPRSSGTASKRTSTSAASSAVGFASGSPLQPEETANRSLVVGVGAKPVDGVRRQDDRLPALIASITCSVKAADPPQPAHGRRGPGRHGRLRSRDPAAAPRCGALARLRPRARARHPGGVRRRRHERQRRGRPRRRAPLWARAEARARGPEARLRTRTADSRRRDRTGRIHLRGDLLARISLCR